MAVYKDGDKWRVIYRYTNTGRANESRRRKEVLRRSGRRSSGNGR